MIMNLWHLYELMLRSRLFELAVAQLWQAGLISGEMHLGIGEEAIVAGVVSQLGDDDALALDHRGTPPLIMRGVDPILLLREMLGCADGLCGGKGGHMHLFSRPHLAASSGIVGASGPAAAGFALAAQHLRPGSVAVAFLGEGAVNQGMMMEAMNLAVAWHLPVLFVCKDNQWAISTVSAGVSSSKPVDRAGGFNMTAVELNGNDVTEVWPAAQEALAHIRSGKGPYFLHTHCSHPEGHFLGDPLLRVIRRPMREMKNMAGPQIRALLQQRGAARPERFAGMQAITSLLGKSARDHSKRQPDPLQITRHTLKKQNNTRLKALETMIEQQQQETVAMATERE